MKAICNRPGNSQGICREFLVKALSLCCPASLKVEIVAVAQLPCYHENGDPNKVHFRDHAKGSIVLESGGEGWRKLPKPRLLRRRRSLLAHSWSASRA